MRKAYLLLVTALLCLGSRAHATNCLLAPGFSAETINAAISAGTNGQCTGWNSSITILAVKSDGTVTTNTTFQPGNIVYLQPGITNLSSYIDFPCNGLQGVLVTGPPNSDPTNPGNLPTATINGPVPGDFGFHVDGCNQHGSTLAFVEYNGNRPNTCYPGCITPGGLSTAPSGGGGSVEIGQSASNFNIYYNYLHGNQGSGYNLENQDSVIYFYGTDTANSSLPYPVTVNVNVGWNHLGNVVGSPTGASDCSNVMTSSFNGPSNTDKNYLDTSGGLCNGLTTVASVTNLNVFNNKIWNQLQCLKVITPNFPSNFLITGLDQTANDCEYNHRNPIEEQARSQGPIGITLQYGDLMNIVYGGTGVGLLFSVPSCCGGTAWVAPGLTNVLDNVIISDNSTGNNTFSAMGIEFMSQGAASYNLMQGSIVNAIQYGYTSNAGGYVWSAQYNVFQLPGYAPAGGTTYIACEGGAVNGNCYAAPTQAGNIQTTTVSALTSAGPTFSPAAQTISAATVVTVTDAGNGANNTTAGPRANTSIWCTTNGSNPVPGTSTFVGTGTGTITVAPGQTLNCIGMWGSRNQPTSYPAGYGFVPSAVASATYTAGSGTKSSVNLSSVGISSSAGNSLSLGATTQMTATCTYSDGSTTTCNSSDAHGNAVSSWTSSNAAITISAAGVATGVSAGSANITATVAAITSPALAVTVTSPPVVLLQSVSVSSTGGAQSLLLGASVQMTATCMYSDGTTTSCSTADSHGNAVSAWTSSNTAAVTVSASGKATAVAAGSTSLTATVAGVTSSSWTISVITPALSSITLATTGGLSSLTAGSSNQLVTTCLYADGSTTNCATMDIDGNAVNPWTSSTPTVATVSTTGLVNGVAAGNTNLTATVTPTAAFTQWGTTGYDFLGDTYPGYINATYTVLGAQAGGYVAGSCSFYLPPATLTVGSQYDCGLIPAPTPTTQGSAWQCWYTYTVTNATWPGGWVTGPMSNCGNLAAGSAWWVGLVTNQPGQSPAAFYDCGSACSGTAPTSGSGNYGYQYVADPYGTRTGLSPTVSPGGSRQAAQYVTLSQPALVSNTVALTVAPPAPVAPPTPTLASMYLTTVGNSSTIVKGGTLQFYAWGVYSDGSVHELPDAQGDKVGLWNTSNHAIAKVSSLGHVTAIAAGTVNVTAYIGSMVSTPRTITITAPPTASKSPSNAAADMEHANLSLTPQGPGVPLDDSFAGPLWSLTSPAGGSASMSQGHLFLGVPGGSNHDALSGQNNAVRVMQPMGDENFDVTIKIDSVLSASDDGTSQGLMVESDDHNYITYALETDGTRIGLSVHTVTNGVAAAVLEDSDLSQYQSPMYLRLTRVGSGFVAFYSVNGQDWTQATSFSSAMAPTAIGPFAANYNDTPADAVTVVTSVGSFEVR